MRALFFILIFLSNYANASSFYFEFGAGASQITNAAPFFGATATGPESMGLGLNSSLFFAFGDGKSVADIQFGIQGLMSNSTFNDHYYTLLTPYPVLRFQISKFYFGGGVSPLVFYNNDTTPGFLSYQTATSALAFLGEVGFLFSVTPKFSLAATGSMQWVTAAGATSPGPVVDVAATMRFYFGNSTGGGSSSNEFKGWRYPFGWELNH